MYRPNGHVCWGTSVAKSHYMIILNLRSAQMTLRKLSALFAFSEAMTSPPRKQNLMLLGYKRQLAILDDAEVRQFDAFAIFVIAELTQKPLVAADFVHFGGNIFRC